MSVTATAVAAWVAIADSLVSLWGRLKKKKKTGGQS